MTLALAVVVKNTKNVVEQICNQMKTIQKKIDAQYPDADVIAQAAEILRHGGLVAFPTETVYGLGANGLDEAACQGIYQAKGRPSDNPLILHISHIDELRPIVRDISKTAQKLIDAFWPGPLTMIFPKADCVPNVVTGGLDTVAVRFPSHPVAMALIHKAGLPIAAPSANTSGKPSPTRAEHVVLDLDGKINMILDGGTAAWGLESTIVDVSVTPPVILRPGAVTKEMMEQVVEDISIDPTLLQKPTADFRPKAPGMKYTHYAPKADVFLVQGNDCVCVINDLAKKQKDVGKKVGVLATDETKQKYHADVVLSVGSRENLEEVGANLFHVLRQFDAWDTDVVYAEMFPLSGEGLAIMNRLQKSAGYRVIKSE